MAHQNHVSIRNINPHIAPCTITVRIIRLWKQPTFGNVNNIASIEMILMDKEGDRIQASVRKNMIKNFENLLTEGETRSISNFYVNENAGSYKILSHPFKINLHKMSSVKKIDTFSGPINGFKFASFRDIMDGKIENNQTVDVIGHVSGYGDVVIGDKNGVPNKRMDVLLQDIDGIKVKCTFWDAYVEDFKSKFSNDKADVNVLVIQFGKLREWRGNFTVSHGFHVARLFLNNHIPEINAFKKRFIEKYGDETANLKIISLPDPSTDAFFGNSRCLRLDELDTIYEATSCVAVATIKSIEAGQPWYYIACRKCNKKVITKNPDDEIEVVGAVNKRTRTTHDCPECGPDVNVIPRFKVNVKVTDESGEASLVLFDRDVVKLIMKTAHNLRETCPDNEAYPYDLDAMIGKRLMFKFELTQFNLKNNYQVYTVSRMTENEIMFQAFYKLYLIGLEFETQAEKAKATECFADALDATNTILGEGVGHSDDVQASECEPDPSNVACHKIVEQSEQPEDVIVVNNVAGSKQVKDINVPAGESGTKEQIISASPPSNKRSSEALEEDQSLQFAPKKPKRKLFGVRKEWA